MVGEMRDPETMRLTLSAAETGHLVLATVHSATCAEALQRVVSAFPAEIQGNVAAQLADCLLAVVSQRLRYRPDLNMRVPECEVLMASHAVRHNIRTRDFFKISSALETGAEQGMWSLARYRAWLEARKKWHVQGANAEPPEAESSGPGLPAETLPAFTPAPSKPRTPAASAPMEAGRIEIEPDETEFGKILKRPANRTRGAECGTRSALRGTSNIQGRVGALR